MSTHLVSNFDPKDTILVLIDNSCKLDLNSCFKIIKDKFSENFVVYNNTLTEKSLLINHLPLEENQDGFLNNASMLEWEYVSKFSKVILISDDSSSNQWKHDKYIDAIFYRIITGKSIILIINGQIGDLSRFYPYFGLIYSTRESEKFEFQDVSDIDNMDEFENLLKDKFSKVFECKSDVQQGRYRYKPLDHSKYGMIYNYVLVKGKRSLPLINELIEQERIDPNDSDQLKNFVDMLLARLSPRELKYYDAYDSLSGSLTDRVQISIAGPDDHEILVFKTAASDYVFRNLRFKNVLVNIDPKNSKFVFPLYESKQATRQTIRFLMMNLYNVHNNSVLIDLIVIYLLMRVSLVTQGEPDTLKLVKTKYKNIHQLFAQRYEKGTGEFIKENKCSLEKLKRWFPELEPLDKEDLFELFSDFVTDGHEISNEKLKRIVATRSLKVVEKGVSNNTENSLPIFTSPKLGFKTPVQIEAANWPHNLNFSCDPQKLQLNASFPFFICCKDYNEFLEAINSIEWMNDLKSCLREVDPNEDKLVLKGGAILDIMCGRKPKDYDLMNIGLDNEAFLKLLGKFVRKTKAEKIELVLGRAVLFRVTMPNKDVLELVMNLKMDKDSLFQENHLPDQICYKPVENTLLANEYTLWSLNYGFCPLELEKRPISRRLSNKLHLLGFNFFYEFDFQHKTRFLKERLERFVWLITKATETGTPSFSAYRQPATQKKSSSDGYEVTFERDLLKTVESSKIVFANKQKFNEYVRNEIEVNKKNVNVDSKSIDFDFSGGIILSEERFDSEKMVSTGLDWSYSKAEAKPATNYDD